MHIKKILSVFLSILLLVMSIPMSASAVTFDGQPEYYLLDFDSSQWGIISSKDTITFENGAVVSSSNNLFTMTYTGDRPDLSDGFVFQVSTVLSGDTTAFWGNVSYFRIGGIMMRIRQASPGIKQPVCYEIEYGSNGYATYRSSAFAISGQVGSADLLAHTDALFTFKYTDGKLTVCNANLATEDNPDGVITWTISSDNSTATELSIEPSYFEETSIKLEKAWGGPECSHVVFDDLYLCDYDFFGNAKPVYTKETQVNIACIGDSITYGVGTYSGYRYYLYEKLFDAGCKFHYVGPYTSSDPRLPAAYSRHAGYSGAVIGPNNNSGSRSSYDFLPQYVTGDAGTADIALIMLGHNNYYQNIDRDNIDEVYKNFVLRIFELNPDITVYCGTMVNETQGRAPDIADGYDENGLNALLPGIVSDLQDEGYDVRFVDLRAITDLSGENGDFSAADGVHPNEQGQEKIGNAWYNAIVGQVKEMNTAGEGSHTATIKPVTGISTDKNTMTLNVGGYSQRINAQILMSDATISTIKWTSSDKNVATVNAVGVVTPVSEGTAVITATTLSGGYTASCTVTVGPEISNKYTLSKVFQDTFTKYDKWTGDTSRLGDSALYIWFPGTNKTTKFETRRHFDVDQVFRMSFDYVCTGNENNFYGHYTSYSYAGFEIRLYDAAKTMEMRFNGEVIGKWTTSFEVNTHSFIFEYAEGTAQLIRDSEIIISAEVAYDQLPETSPIGIYSGEFNRYAVLYGVRLDTLNEVPQFIDESPVDTDDTSSYETVIDGFTADGWESTSPSGATVSASNGALCSNSNAVFFSDYAKENVDISKGFKLDVTTDISPTSDGSPARFWGASTYISVGDVAFRIQTAYDYKQARNYPLSLYVYTDTEFDILTGDMISGTIAGALYTDAVGTANTASPEINQYANASYTLYYDGTYLYIKHATLGTINFERADGSVGAAIPVDASSFSDASVHIYKWSGGNSGTSYKYFSDFSLTAANAVTLTDAAAPSISGVTDGKSYCCDQTVTVTDSHLKSVTVDGTASSASFTLSTGEHTITAVDYAGNETTYTVTISDVHSWDTFGAVNDDGTISAVCGACGQTGSVVLGDANGDGAVDSADVLILIQHILNINTVDGITVFDFDKNGILDSSDLVIIQMYVLGTATTE